MSEKYKHRGCIVIGCEEEADCSIYTCHKHWNQAVKNLEHLLTQKEIKKIIKYLGHYIHFQEGYWGEDPIGAKKLVERLKLIINERVEETVE